MSRTDFSWDPLSDNILQERDESGTVTAEYTTEPGLYGNLISQNRGGIESQYHFDPQGSALALTDDNQQVTDTYAYSAFGQTLEQSGTTVNFFRYLGRYEYVTEDTFGTLYVRERRYSYGTGRWMSKDPLSIRNAANLYEYLDSSPLNGIDPSGRIVVDALVPINDKKSPWKCGDNPAMLWDFLLESPAPCAGYLVQKVTIRCARDPDCEQCFKPLSLWPPALTTSFTYCEAWTVAKGEIFPMPRAILNGVKHTDQGSVLIGKGECGNKRADGEIRFFCKDTSDDGKMKGIGDLTEQGWGAGRFYGLGTGCQTGAGELLSKEKPFGDNPLKPLDEPEWWDLESWKDPNIPPEPAGNRYIQAVYCCCDDLKPRIRVDASPGASLRYCASSDATCFNDTQYGVRLCFASPFAICS